MKKILLMILTIWLFGCSEKTDIGLQDLSFKKAFSQAKKLDKQVLVYFFSPT